MRILLVAVGSALALVSLALLSLLYLNFTLRSQPYLVQDWGMPLGGAIAVLLLGVLVLRRGLKRP